MAIYTGTAPSSLYADYLIDLSVRSQDERANTTTLNYRIFLRSKSGGYPFSSQQHKLDFTADGRTIVNTTTSYKVPAGGEFTLASGTFTVAHNSDGAKSFNFSSGFASYHGTCLVSGSMALPKLNRGSTLSITSVYGGTITSADIDTEIRLKVNKGSSTYTHKVGYEIVGDGSTLTSDISYYNDNVGYVDFLIPESWLSAYFKNNVSKTVYFYVKTYNSGSLIHTDTKTLTVSVPENVLPSVDEIEVLESDSTVSSVFGSGFYQNLSTYNVRITASGVSGSTITSYKIEMDGKIYTSSTSSVYLPSIARSGDIDVKVTATDSRNRSSSMTVTIAVLPYNLPKISTFTVARQSSGSSAEATLKASHTAVGSPDKNAADITVMIKKVTESTWTTVYSATSNVPDFNESILLGSTLDMYVGYNVRATIADKFSTHSANATLPSADNTMVFDYSNNSVGIGGIPDSNVGRNGLHVHGNIKAGGRIINPGAINYPIHANSTFGNDLFTPGFYSFRNMYGLPGGVDGNGTLVVTKAGGYTTINTTTDCIQTFYSKSNHICMRNSIGLSNAWTSWAIVAGG